MKICLWMLIFPMLFFFFLTKGYIWDIKKNNFPFQINEGFNSDFSALGMVTVSELQVPVHLSDSDLSARSDTAVREWHCN